MLYLPENLKKYRLLKNLQHKVFQNGREEFPKQKDIKE